MKRASRRVFIARMWLVALAPVTQVFGSTAAPRPIDIVARRFNYSPNLITIKVGEPVVLRFQALDFTHGFSLPAMNLRADLIAGQITEVPITATAAGRYPFLCDNFCGSGHEQMEGLLVVQ